MSVIVKAESERVVSARVSGRLNSREWHSAQQEVAKVMQTQPTIALLVIAENFQGWEGTDWEDMAFQVAHDRQIERMAIVADAKWKDEVLMFAGQGVRRFDIKYFAPSELAQAKAWASAPDAKSA
jgi:hypothetical protein